MAENELIQLFGGREDLVNIELKGDERNEEANIELKCAERNEEN